MTRKPKTVPELRTEIAAQVRRHVERLFQGKGVVSFNMNGWRGESAERLRYDWQAHGWVGSITLERPGEVALSAKDLAGVLKYLEREP